MKHPQFDLKGETEASNEMNLEEEAKKYLKERFHEDEYFCSIDVAQVMTDFYKHQFKKDIESLTDEMIERQLPQADINNVANATLNHYCIESVNWAKQHYLKLNR
jgi:hypothetical protein